MDVPQPSCFAISNIFQVLPYIRDSYQEVPNKVVVLIKQLSSYARVLTSETSLSKLKKLVPSEGAKSRHSAILLNQEAQKNFVMVIDKVAYLTEKMTESLVDRNHILSSTHFLKAANETNIFDMAMEEIERILFWSVDQDRQNSPINFVAIFVSVFVHDVELIRYIVRKENLQKWAGDVIEAFDSVSSNVLKKTISEKRSSYEKFYEVLMRPEYFYHPLRGMFCRISGQEIQYGDISVDIEQFLGLPEGPYTSILEAYATLDPKHSMKGRNGDWLKEEELIEIVASLPDKDKIWYNIGMLCIFSDRWYDVEWLIERHLLYDCRTGGCSFLKDLVISTSTDIDVVRNLTYRFIDNKCFTDECDELGMRIIHYLILRPEEDEIVMLVTDLVESELVSEMLENEQVDIYEHAKQYNKLRMAKILRENKKLRADFELISENLFERKHGMSGVKIFCTGGNYSKLSRKLKTSVYKRGCVVGVLFEDPSRKRRIIENTRIREILAKEGIKYSFVAEDKYTFVEYAKLKCKAFTKNNPSPVKEIPPVVEIQTATIAPIGGGHRERKQKPQAPPEVIAPKFTEAERNAVYIRIQTERAARLYNSCALFRKFDEAVVVKVTLSEYKLHVQRTLGHFYSEELAIYCYSIQHYDPKTAIPAERSICSSQYAEFKSRNNAVVSKVYDPEEEKSLVELRPRRVSDEKPVAQCNSIHLKAAVHEFLFMKGVWSWFRGLIKPEEVHESILMDCTRLCATRFYNAILLYHREGGTNISINDAECAHLRNILVHNVEVFGLKEHVETVLFPFGEKVFEFFKTARLEGSVIVLRDCEIYSFEVQDAEKLQGRLCRDPVLRLLARMRLYISLLESKIACDGGSALLNCLNRHWDKIADELKIWIHHARAIESCILQIGQLSRSGPKFLNKEVQSYVSLCREVRHVGHHENSNDDEWNFDPINPSFLADMMRGVPKL